jgi:hypothetical protein
MSAGEKKYDLANMKAINFDTEFPVHHLEAFERVAKEIETIAQEAMQDGQEFVEIPATNAAFVAMGCQWLKTLYEELKKAKAC